MMLVADGWDSIFFVDGFERAHHFGSIMGVERRQGFIRHNHFRSLNGGFCNGHMLLLAAGKRIDPLKRFGCHIKFLPGQNDHALSVRLSCSKIMAYFDRHQRKFFSLILPISKFSEGNSAPGRIDQSVDQSTRHRFPSPDLPITPILPPRINAHFDGIDRSNRTIFFGNPILIEHDTTFSFRWAMIETLKAVSWRSISALCVFGVKAEKGTPRVDGLTVHSAKGKPAGAVKNLDDYLGGREPANEVNSSLMY